MTKTTKRKGLGRGLDALLSANVKVAAAKDPDGQTSSAVDATSPQDKDGTLAHLPIEFLQRGKYQPRRDMQSEALQELADSIKAQGVMQPIVVRPLGDNRYEIIAGERRWRASQLAGLEKIPAVIRDVPDEAAIAMALIENIQREDLNPVEEAIALKRLQDEFELTHQEVAEAVGKSRTAVSNTLRLLNLCTEVRTLLEHGDIEMGHARALLAVNADNQRSLANIVVTKSLSVRQTEILVRKHQEDEKTPPAAQQKASGDILKLQDNLSEKIGVPVQVVHSAKGSGKLVLKYNSLDELDGILSHLGYES